MSGVSGAIHIGQQPSANSVPVVISSDQGPVTVTISSAVTVTGGGSSTVSISSGTLAERYFNATFATLTRSTTAAYAINTSISNSSIAVSVTALSATVVNSNNAPFFISSVIVDTNDTALAAACQLRAYLFNSDPTANSGVGAGDAATYSNKRAGYIGSMVGYFQAFSDGGKARLVPEVGSYIMAFPVTSSQNVYIQYQTLTAFTPSSSNSTLIGTVSGVQGST
jgi:hypothetical protein